MSRSATASIQKPRDSAVRAELPQWRMWGAAEAPSLPPVRYPPERAASATVLCLDGDASARSCLDRAISAQNHRVLSAGSWDEGLLLLDAEPVHLVIADPVSMGMSSVNLLESMRAAGHSMPVITMGVRTDDAEEAIHAGAADHLDKPLSLPRLEVAVSRTLELLQLRRERDRLRQDIAAHRSREHLVGESRPMHHLLRLIAQGAPTRSTVLIQGESGTGKELVARAMHELSDRSLGPFVTLSCGALPGDLIETALFGHERGAFPGAMHRVAGAFERAHGGTLLLDEISELPLEIQPRLLRVLEEHEFTRLGGTTPIRADVRVIATTNRDLVSEAAAGRFRHDLFFRLGVLPLHVPPLRERLGDLPLLIARFAADAAAEHRKTIVGFAPATLEVLRRYDWPGNVRELQHAVQRAVILTTEPLLQPHHFVEALAAAAAAGGGGGRERAIGSRLRSRQGPAAVAVLMSHSLAEAEALLIQRALATTGGNRSRAAALLGISVRTLRNKLNGA